METAPAPATAAEEKDSGTANKDSKKSGNTAKDSDSKDNSKEMKSVSDKDGKLVHGKFTYVISKDRTLCRVYYDGKYKAYFTVNDGDGEKVELDNITIRQDKNGCRHMDIIAGESADTVKVTVNKKSTYCIATAIGVRTVSVNGTEVPLTIKKVPSALTTEDTK